MSQVILPKIPSPFDHTGLPVGLPDPIYATWLVVRRELLASVGVEQGERHYQFCCGYVQALQDAKSIDDRLSSFLSRELLESWITVREALVGKSR